MLYISLGGAADRYLKHIFCEQKRFVIYVCCGPVLTTTNPLAIKIGLLKLNEMFNLHVSKFMLSTLTGLDVVLSVNIFKMIKFFDFKTKT